MANARDNNNTLVSRAHSLMLQTYIHRLEIAEYFQGILARYFLAKAEFPMGQSHFPQWKNSLFIHKFLKL